MSGLQATLHVRHRTRYVHAAPVELAHHLVHLRPRDTAQQRVSGWRLEVQPEPDGGAHAIDASADVFGNWRHGFSHARVHEQLDVLSTFQATLTAPVPVALASPPWQQVAAALRYRAGRTMPPACEFALDSPRAPRAREFVRFAAGVFTPGRPLLEAAQALMERVHGEFEYRVDSTDVTTPAQQALQARRGVCQDFAHVMIAACRSMGLAARYVSGYLSTQPPAGHGRLVGSEASHAWVSVWCPANGWVDFDPTNNLRPALAHITLAWGRDYGDVAPLRGVIRGGTAAVPQVQVTVEPV
ncbi:MAG: transglutaminase family protein [Ideonella sp.]|nr:transglutaminase family protein [Ideonella sp.]MCC7459406.1 transglutaminase family protein [Nitrospira sp.]